MFAVCQSEVIAMPPPKKLLDCLSVFYWLNDKCLSRRNT